MGSMPDSVNMPGGGSIGPVDPDVSRLIDRAVAGDVGAATDLLPRVYAQLRAIAQVRMAGERRDHTLQATALVHEAYMRLVGDSRLSEGGRARFMFVAAEAMQRILVEHARSRGRVKRGGGRGKLALDVLDLAAADSPTEIVALDEAVRRLNERDPVAGQVVRLRFYAGLSVEQTAAAMGISERTVKREWQFARAWLHRAMGEMTGESVGEPDESGER